MSKVIKIYPDESVPKIQFETRLLNLEKVIKIWSSNWVFPFDDSPFFWHLTHLSWHHFFGRGPIRYYDWPLFFLKIHYDLAVLIKFGCVSKRFYDWPFAVNNILFLRMRKAG